ncbi:MAG: methyltransferase domain-containing protein [Gammaproteobacteria bacterium]|nr:methyltransferase domain-containing protein [Gammaproteobacteria bacterium]
MEFEQFRESNAELERTEDIVRIITLLEKTGDHALDIGARDGYFSVLLTEYFKKVTALDLSVPVLTHERVECVQGDLTKLKFSDNSVEFILCTEVLEHIPTPLLSRACAELSRVSADYLLIGVPLMQDIRVGRTTCFTCGGKNPPWGHVNSFDKKKIIELFPDFTVIEESFVGENSLATNSVSRWFFDLAGNPYGSYTQEEPCIHCGGKLISPPQRNMTRKIFTKLGMLSRFFQRPFIKPHPNWIHLLFKKTLQV